MPIHRKWTYILNFIVFELGLLALTIVIKDLWDGEGMNWMIAGLIPISAAYLYFWARHMNADTWESLFQEKQERKQGIWIPDKVTITDKVIRSSRPKRPTQEIRLEDINEIRIVTYEGPVAIPDVWIILIRDEEHSCVFRSDARGHQAVIDYILELPGCNHEQFTKAMADTDDNEYLIWRKDMIAA